MSLVATVWAADNRKADNKSLKKWTADIPAAAKDPNLWSKLQDDLLKARMYYGVFAAANRRLMFFQDADSKEESYRGLVALIDAGLPFSANASFVPGDLESRTDSEFDNNYYFYKGVINLGKGARKWADYYFDKVDKKNFLKFHFFEALQVYQDGKLDEAAERLQTILQSPLSERDASFAKRVARTLARIRFEQKNYEKSFRIYDDFLLKTNPLNPSDWIEAAWNLYYLGEYSKVLGHLFNMESKSVLPVTDLDRYVLRALVYLEHCDMERMESLINSFLSDFQRTVTGIKTGAPLSGFEQLSQIDIPQNKDHQHYVHIVRALRSEKGNVRNLNREVRPLAEHLYKSEIEYAVRQERSVREEALKRAAEKLIIMNESLSFLSFDAAREKFNPDKVFQTEKKSKRRVFEIDNDRYQVIWSQHGDYWRDERRKYWAELANRCHE